MTSQPDMKAHTGRNTLLLNVLTCHESNPTSTKHNIKVFIGYKMYLKNMSHADYSRK